MPADGTGWADVIDENIAVILLFALFVAVGSPPPVTLSSEIQTGAVKTGDVVALRVTVAWSESVVRVVPRLERWRGPFELVGFEVAEQSEGALTRRTWVIRFRSFEAGHANIPGVPFEYQLGTTSEVSSIEAPASVVDVIAPAVDLDRPIRPLRGPLTPQRDGADYSQIVSAVLLVLALAVYFAFWLKTKYLALIARPRAFDRRRALKRLQSSLKKTPVNIDHFYEDLSATTRRFLETTYGIRATVFSSSEIVAAMDERPPDCQAPALADALIFMDAVRFGARIPTSQENRDVLDRIGVLLSADRPQRPVEGVGTR
jgi:hypothetical protein